jgi:hypothetical protein
MYFVKKLTAILYKKDGMETIKIFAYHVKSIKAYKKYQDKITEVLLVQ